MDPLTLFSYVPVLGVFVFLVALAVVAGVVIRLKRQTTEVVNLAPSGHGLLSDKRVFPLLITMIVLVVGLGASLVVVKNQQDNRSNASNCPNGWVESYPGSGVCDPLAPGPSQQTNPENPKYSEPVRQCNGNDIPDCQSVRGNTGSGCWCEDSSPGNPSDLPGSNPIPNTNNCQTCYNQGKDCVASVNGGDCVAKPTTNTTNDKQIVDFGNHINYANRCLDAKCTSGGCTVINNCSFPVELCGNTYDCEGVTTGYCGPTWNQIATGSDCKTVSPGATGIFGQPETTKCGSWQADVTIKGYTSSDQNGLASAAAYDCGTTTSNGGPTPTLTPTPTPTPVGPVCNQTCTGTGQGNCPTGLQCLVGVCRNPSCATNANCQCGTPVADAACNQVVADKTLSTLQPGDTVTFTGYGWVDKAADSIDLVNFIITKNGVEDSNTNVTAVRAPEKDVAGYYYYKASKSYTISSIGSYAVKTRVHWVGGNLWRD